MSTNRINSQGYCNIMWLLLLTISLYYNYSLSTFSCKCYRFIRECYSLYMSIKKKKNDTLIFQGE